MAEIQQSEREDKFKRLVWDMQVGVLLHGPQSEILLSNPKALELLGITEDQLFGKTSFDPDWNVIHEDGTPFPGLFHPVPQSIALRKPVMDVIMGVYRPSAGDRVWLLVHAVPQLTDDGTVQQVVCTFINITRRREAEAAIKKLNTELEYRVNQRTSELLISNDALRQSKEKYRTVADFTYDWEFWLDQNDVIRYCSPSCERITGYHAGEFIQNPQLIHEIIHPDDREGNQCHEHNEEMAKDTNQEIQFRIIRSDGTIRWIGHVCQPVYNDSGEFTGIRGGNRDITGRKNMEQQLKTSEQKYKLLSENITDGIFIIRNGCFEYVNKAMARIFEYEDYEMIGLSLSQLVTSDHREDLIKFLTFDIHLKQGWSIEIECIKKSLKIVIVEIQINYVVNEGLVYGIVHDVTEKKQIQKNIVKAIIQTEEKERASFSKELHDGLGPLLSLIKHYMQWTQRPNSNKSSDDIIKKAEIVIDEALATVKEISNKLSPHILTSYGLTSAIQSFIDKLEETSEINIEFESNVAKRSDLEIEAALYRAVIECINNTIKHARARKIIIRLHDSDNQLYVQYTDDGIGFDVPNALSQQKGLGLFNLQNRIQTIGGKISMQSSPGNGVNYQIIVNLTN